MNKKGKVLKYKHERIGECKYNNQGKLMTIIDYKSAIDITVKFEGGYIVTKKTYNSFKIGNIRSTNLVFGVGMSNIKNGKYKSTIAGKQQTMQYRAWINMLSRCYDQKSQKKYPTYIGCSVCEEWLNFQNFGKWYDENYYNVPNEKTCLDKDILIKGNKVYSPDTCCFVPETINQLFTKHTLSRGKYPIGVILYKELNKYGARCNNNFGNHQYLGMFNTEIEAFNVYKDFKEKVIKYHANRYKEYINNNVYDALINYKVEITD